MLRFATTLILLMTFSFTVDAATPLNFGFKQTLQSKILGEARPIFIKLPAGYETQTDRTYPVIYALDGDTHFNLVAGTVQWLSRSGRKNAAAILWWRSPMSTVFAT